MSTRPSFSIGCTIQSGRVELDSEAQYRSLVRNMPEGRYTIKVEKYVPQRSLDQNAYLHAGPLPVLKREFGYDSTEELKRDLMGECWGWTTSPITGRQIPMREHTSDMDVQEFSHFIDWLIPWAMVKWGIVLPLPDERLKQSA